MKMRPDKMRGFPPQSKSNPGHHDIRQVEEREKLIRNPSRGPTKRKSKSKGKA